MLDEDFNQFHQIRPKKQTMHPSPGGGAVSGIRVNEGFLYPWITTGESIGMVPMPSVCFSPASSVLDEYVRLKSMFWFAKNISSSRVLNSGMGCVQ